MTNQGTILSSGMNEAKETQENYIDKAYKALMNKGRNVMVKANHLGRPECAHVTAGQLQLMGRIELIPDRQLCL
jgi:hypothetical protein